MRLLLLSMLLVACGAKSDGICQQAVAHVFELTVAGPPGSEPKAEEARVIDSVKSLALSRCRSEGLSRAQADCILAAHAPEWSDQLRACAAFAAKPPSWITVGPTRDERRALLKLPPMPDGPRESKRHYRQLVALPRTTCGLADSGSVECWGAPLEAPFPAGDFIQIASSGEVSCGRDALGELHCALRDTTSSDHTPSDVFSDFALDSGGGCGVRASDKQLVCWSFYDNAPLDAPPGQFNSVVMRFGGACARTVDGVKACFGKDSPALPPADVLAYSSDEGSCSISKDHRLACIGTFRLGPPPTGTFDTVAISRGHACATRTGGGTVCWGENDDGSCNVPQ
jgi:hypothetical protein